MDQQVDTRNGIDHGRRRRSVAGERQGAAGARWTEDLLRPDRGPVDQDDDLPFLQHAALPAGGHTECVREGDVEASGPRRLGHEVADRVRTVVDGERPDGIAGPLDHVARTKLHRLEREGQVSENAAQPCEQLAEAARAVERQWDLATT